MKTKRLFAILLALVMAFSFAACGGKEKEPTKPTKNYVELNEDDTGSGLLDGSTVCMNFTVPEGLEYVVSNYDVNLDLEEYNFRLRLKKDDTNIYFADVEYAFNDTAQEEYEAFIEAKTFDDTTITRLDDVTVGDITFKVFKTADNIGENIYYIYTFDCTATNHKMNLIVSPSLIATPMDAPEITAFFESIVTK